MEHHRSLTGGNGQHPSPHLQARRLHEQVEQAFSQIGANPEKSSCRLGVIETLHRLVEYIILVEHCDAQGMRVPSFSMPAIGMSDRPQAPPAIGPRLVDVHVAAEMLGVSEGWIYRNQRHLPFVRKIGARGIRCSLEALIRYQDVSGTDGSSS